MKPFAIASVSVLLALLPVVARAEPPSEAVPGLDPSKPMIAVNAGLVQPLALGGANVEVDFRWGHFVASYSHGWTLDMEGGLVVGDMKAQNVALHLPYSTGFGVGYQIYFDAIRSFVDLRAEGKIHRFEASYLSADESRSTRIADYTTYTVGGGLYWTLVPFAHRKDALKGIDVSTSFRVWPKVADTLAVGGARYQNATTGRDETHRAANIGIADTPIIVNVSVGYIFQ